MNPKEMKELMMNRAKEQGIDLKALHEGIETKVYCIPAEMKVPPHSHASQDEIFYCIKGSGVGIADEKEIELTAGEVFIAPAGSMHTLKTDDVIIVTAFLIPVNRMICHCRQVSYGDIRKAMVGGARTVAEIRELTGAGTGCGKCIPEIEKILSLACGCKKVTVEAVVKAVQEGADTVEKIGAVTGAGTACGKCGALLQNIIDTRR